MGRPRPASRLLALAGLGIVLLSGVPTAAAHGGGHYLPGVHQWYALVPLLGGLGVVAAGVFLRRSDYAVGVGRLLTVVFFGLVVAAFGAVALVQLSPVLSLNVSQRPLTSETLTAFRLIAGVAVIAGSFAVGRLRWPERPRYAVLGVLLGAWVVYPAAFDNLGLQSSVNPAGYVLFASVLAGVAYIAYRDARHALAALAADPLARRFGVAVGLLAAVFFMFSAGILIIFPDPTGNISWAHSFVRVLPVKDPLVYWPAVEFWFPSLPLTGYLSLGMMALVLSLAALVGVNAAIVAYQWHCRDDAGFNGAAGAAAIAAPNACCCCGPVLSQLAVVALGPTAAMPFYWLFIDVSSPFGVLFFAASFALLLGNLVRFANAVTPTVADAAPNAADAPA
ncbi:hypothetical protein [Halocalculus aciditolerans]|nr:hypothetical protein [Halocalculus aciditolerans]